MPKNARLDTELGSEFAVKYGNTLQRKALKDDEHSFTNLGIAIAGHEDL
jgi:hypothetical protein